VENAPGFLWTKSHAKQPFTLLAANHRDEAAAPTERTTPPANAPADPGATPKPKAERAAPGVSLITGTVNVYYHVADLHDFLYSHEDPKKTLEALCYRELTRYTANSDFLEFLGTRRRDAVESLRKAIQGAATERKLGVRIVAVSLQGLHPPVEVAGSFEEVVGALEEKEAKVWQARGHANSVLPAARAVAAMTLAAARIYTADRQQVGPAVEKEFLMQLEAYREAPSVFKHRKLLSAVQEALATARKIIRPVWANVHDVLTINLDEKTTPGVSLSTDLGGQ
jgi:membrane protease subunit HflK